MNEQWAVAAAAVATAVLLAHRVGSPVSMRRLIPAGLITLLLVPLARVSEQLSPVAEFLAIWAVILAVGLVLPHYFYRGEPLLPDRRRRR